MNYKELAEIFREGAKKMDCSCCPLHWNDTPECVLEITAMVIDRIADEQEEKGANMDETKQGGVIDLDIEMETRAMKIAGNYIWDQLDTYRIDGQPTFELYIVWKAKILQHWKFLISSTLNDGMYYELTYNGDKREWYLDAYKKVENRRITDEPD